MTLRGLISIDPNRGSVPYNRMIFGQFLEHFHRQVYGGVFEPGSPLTDEQGFRTDVITALRELRVPVVRWPGGCFVSAYHWQDGIGPQRRCAYDKAWRVEDPNTFGTDEFIDWCRKIGAEPYICTNAGTGTAEEMSDWVEYCNLPSQGHWARQRIQNGRSMAHTVHYWSIGNENYGAWEMGAKTAGEWGRLVVESAKMMKRVDPSILLLAAALPDLDWTLNLLRSAGPFLDFVSIHSYFDPLWQKDEPSPYADCVLRAGQVDTLLRQTEQVIAVAGYTGKIKIAFDEWNLRGWHHPDGNSPQAIQARDRNDIHATYTMADAVFSAGLLNDCLRHAGSLEMANMAPVVNTRGPLFVHPGGIVKRTTFHTLAMYANLLADRVSDAFVSSDVYAREGASIPAVDAVATCAAAHDGAAMLWRIAMVNRHPAESVHFKIVIAGVPIDGVYLATQLIGDSTDAFNDIASPNRVIPLKTNLTLHDGGIDLPPHSITILEIE
jgi:alpha-L-arabinofuranosidase